MNISYAILSRIKYNCVLCNSTGENNSFYGKKHSDETKKKQRNIKLNKYDGENNPFYGKKHNTNSIEKMRKKLSIMFSGENNPFYGKKHSDETKKKQSSIQKKYADQIGSERYRDMGIKSVSIQAAGKKTSIEKKVENYLKKLNIPYKYNMIIKDVGQYDFLLYDNIILEVHGDYWHANPKIYGKNKKQINDRQKYKIKKDIFKKNQAEKLGYFYFIIWETDINNNNMEIINEIRINRNK